MVGGLVFQPLLGKLLDYTIPLAQTEAAAYQLSLSIIPVGFLITILLIWSLPCPHKRAKQIEERQQKLATARVHSVPNKRSPASPRPGSI